MAGSPHIAAIVLAAGRSTRMGAANKLTADVGGKPMVRRVVEAALASCGVAGAGGDRPPGRGRAGGAGRARRSRFVDNPDYAVGLSSSLKAGIRAVPPAADGALVLLGDMPQITAAHLDRLIAAFAAEGGAAHRRADARGRAAATRCCGRAPASRRCCNSRATPAPSGCSRRTRTACARWSLARRDLRRRRHAGGAGAAARGSANGVRPRRRGMRSEYHGTAQWRGV